MRHGTQVKSHGTNVCEELWYTNLTREAHAGVMAHMRVTCPLLSHTNDYVCCMCVCDNVGVTMCVCVCACV